MLLVFLKILVRVIERFLIAVVIHTKAYCRSGLERLLLTNAARKRQALYAQDPLEELALIFAGLIPLFYQVTR